MLIEKGGTSSPVSKEMKLSGADILNIPDGGFVELLNTSSHKLFRSTQTGRLNIVKIMTNAEMQATDNAGAIHGNLHGMTGRKNKRQVYNETGMVMRSTTALDPAVAAMNLTAEKLCERVAGAIRSYDFSSPAPMPANITSDTATGMKVRIDNVSDYPVYFNIFRISPGTARLEVSELGQPIGNYMLGNNQSVTREQFSNPEPGYRHIVLIVPVPFNLNSLLKDVGDMMKRESLPAPDTDLPVYMKLLD